MTPCPASAAAPWPPPKPRAREGPFPAFTWSSAGVIFADGRGASNTLGRGCLQIFLMPSERILANPTTAAGENRACA